MQVKTNTGRVMISHNNREDVVVVVVKAEAVDIIREAATMTVAMEITNKTKKARAEVEEAVVDVVVEGNALINKIVVVNSRHPETLLSTRKLRRKTALKVNKKAKVDPKNRSG